MEKPLKILMVSSEAIPFAKAGGLADVVPTLAKELAKIGHDVRIILPRYYFIDRKALEKHPAQLEMAMPAGKVRTELYISHLPDSGVPVYFVDYETYYGRDGIYGTSTEPDFADNPLRFTLLNKAAFSLCRLLYWFPDIMHAHDWPAAPCLAYLDNNEKDGPFAKTAGVFSIHNVGYQGLFPAEQFTNLGLPWSEFVPGSFEFFGRCNFMQGALRHAHQITTVSPTYAKEITTAQFGFGMEGILTERKRELSGILNGMDYDAWTPSNDTLLPHHFELGDMEGKTRNKLALQEACGLEKNPDVPVFGIISRMVGQKGFMELAAPGFGSLPKILADFPLQIVVLGTGEKWCEEEMLRLSKAYPRMKVFLTYSEKMSHLIQAGADFFLMPSLYEPCGLTQMYALRYGTVPIVAPTGGLADTVKDIDTNPKQSTGIYVDLPVQPASIYKSVEYAMHLWLDRRSAIKEMQERGMKERFTWDESTKDYVKVYRNAIAIRNMPSQKTEKSPR